MLKKSPQQKTTASPDKMKQSKTTKDVNADPVDVKREADERQKDLQKHKPSKAESQNSKGQGD